MDQTGNEEATRLKVAGATFVAAMAVVYLGRLEGWLFVVPWLSGSARNVLVESLLGLGFVLLPVGVTAVVIGSPSFRRGLAGYLATGFTWMGAIGWIGRVREAVQLTVVEQADRPELQIDGTLPWAAGDAIWSVLFGVGVACLGIALTRTPIAPRVFGLVGVALASLTAVLAYLRLLGAPTQYWVGLGLTLLWLAALGVLVYRYGSKLATGREPVT